jgi:hypothetical protein
MFQFIVGIALVLIGISIFLIARGLAPRPFKGFLPDR